MIEKGKTYEVYDGKGRFWGHVCLKHPFNSPYLGSKSISGYLDASSDFNEVQHLFIEHDKFMSSNGVVDEEGDNSKEIAQLGVVLLNPETGKRLCVDPVFVSDKLLFTCGLDEHEI